MNALVHNIIFFSEEESLHHAADALSKRYNLFIPVDEDRMADQCEHEYCPARIHTHERSVILRGMTIRTRAVV